MKKIAIAFILICIVSLFSFADEKKNQISILAGINAISQTGCYDCSYEPGVNDFPVTPAHKNMSFAFNYGYFITGNVSFELDFRYHMGTEVTMIDPSDQETVDVDTFNNYSVTGNVVFRFSGGTVRPYVTAGAGMNMLSTYEREFTSDRGSVIIITAPDKTSNLVFNVGGGIVAGSPIGLRVDVRYASIRNLNVDGIQILAGVAFKF